MEKYLDRKQAGKVLAEQLNAYTNRKDAVVLALPRGGVPVAYEVANTLNLPLDVLIVRKLGVPGHEELAMGAIAMDGVTVFNDEIVNQLGVSKAAIENVIKAESEELKRREIRYRGKRPFPSLANKVIILVDDGIATGATMYAAIKALRQFNPASIVVAVPVAEASTCKKIAKVADKIICPMQPHLFYSVGSWYDYFDQTKDEEVIELLAKNATIPRM